MLLSLMSVTVKSRKLIVAISLLALFMFTGCKQQASAEGYKYFPDNFVNVINGLGTDSLWSSPVVLGKGYDKGTDERKKISWILKSSRHIDEISSRLCTSVVDAYSPLLTKEILGDEGYIFDQELASIAKSAGAFELPPRIVDGRMEIKMLNRSWDGTSGDINESNREFSDLYLAKLDRKNPQLPSGMIYEDKGIITLKRNFSQGNLASLGVLKTLQSVFRDNSGIVMNDFDLRFDIARSFLFVIEPRWENKGDELVHVYVEFPYTVYSESPGVLTSLSQTPDTKVGCYVRSVSQGRRHRVDDKDFIGDKIAMDMIPDFFEPLTFPLYSDKVDADGTRVVNQDNIVEQSLRCLIRSIGDQEQDQHGCLGTDAAAKFMELLNQDICISYSKVVKAPRLNYPYESKFGSNDLYTSPARPLSDSCGNFFKNNQ